MRDNKTIRLHIPEPCHEDWQQMTPCQQGRFCGQCQKTVVDFSTWSDSALFDFFNSNTASVCGRFMNTQLHREIHIPYQPKSRLYRIAIACGLTLMFAQAPESHAMVKQPVEILTTDAHETTAGDEETGTIRGKITDDKGNAAVGTLVEVFMGATKKASIIADHNGSFEVKELPAGSYKLTVSFGDLENIERYNVVVSEQDERIVDLTFQASEIMMMGIVAPGSHHDGATVGEVAPVRDTAKHHKPPMMKGKVKRR